MIKLRNVTDSRNGQFYSTVIVDESKVSYFTPSAAEPVQIAQGSWISNDIEQRVTDLEDAVVELAEIIAEE